MSEELDTARRYRQHAEELRIIAAESGGTHAQALLQIAEDYDRMAASLEAIDKTNRRLRADR
jgi:hypothetical protein